MERTFNQKVIELAYPQVASICVERGVPLKEAQVIAIADMLLLLAERKHSEAYEYLQPFLLAAARQILNPVPQTDEYREQLNDIVKHELLNR